MFDRVIYCLQRHQYFMAHFIKLNVLDLGHDNNENETNRKYIPNLINLDMVINIEPSIVHSLIFTKNNLTHPIRVKESLGEILDLSKNCHGDQKNQLNGWYYNIDCQRPLGFSYSKNMNYKQQLIDRANILDVYNSIYKYVWDSVINSVHRDVRQSVNNSVWNSVRDSVNNSVNNSVYLKLKMYNFAKQNEWFYK